MPDPIISAVQADAQRVAAPVVAGAVADAHAVATMAADKANAVSAAAHRETQGLIAGLRADIAALHARVGQMEASVKSHVSWHLVGAVALGIALLAAAVFLAPHLRW